MTATMKLLYRVPEVCEMTGLSRSKIYELLACGEIRTVKIGKSVRITPEALNEWLQRQVEN